MHMPPRALQLANDLAWSMQCLIGFALSAQDHEIIRMPNTKRDWNQSGRKSSLVRNGPKKLLVRVDARATELEDR
jgi:hypothetical protein